MTLRELLKEVQKWHQKQFPDITKAEQLEKVEEEYREYLEALNKADVEEERADLFIACAGAMRFDSLVAKYFINKMCVLADIESVKNLHREVLKKLEILKNSKFERVGNVYKRIKVAGCGGE